MAWELAFTKVDEILLTSSFLLHATDQAPIHRGGHIFHWARDVAIDDRAKLY